MQLTHNKVANFRNASALLGRAIARPLQRRYVPV